MGARLWAHRALLFTLVKRDLKIRYKSTALGFVWSFGKPLLLMLVIWAVFSVFVRIPSSHPWLPYPLHILTALLPWMFLSSSLNEALFAIRGNSGVIKKVWVPPEVFPVATVLSNLVHLVLANMALALIIVAYALLGHAPATGEPLGTMVLPGWEIIFLPVLVALQTLFILGVALVISSLNVFYHDVASITEIVLSAWFYLTPVIYASNFAREELEARGLSLVYWIYLCNPMTAITIGYRRVIYGQLFRHGPEVHDATLLKGLGVSALVTLLLLWAGATLFSRMSRRFADEL
jgi:ABC-type polysaccharide/polyol phosphate export permease